MGAVAWQHSSTMLPLDVQQYMYCQNERRDCSHACTSAMENQQSSGSLVGARLAPTSTVATLRPALRHNCMPRSARAISIRHRQQQYLSGWAAPEPRVCARTGVRHVGPHRHQRRLREQQRGGEALALVPRPPRAQHLQLAGVRDRNDLRAPVAVEVRRDRRRQQVVRRQQARVVVQVVVPGARAQGRRGACGASAVCRVMQAASVTFRPCLPEYCACDENVARLWRLHRLMEAAQLQRSAPGLPEGERAFILHGIVDGKGREQQDAKVSPIHPAVKRCCSGCCNQASATSG